MGCQGCRANARLLYLHRLRAYCTFRMESANFMIHDTSKPLRARFATIINVTGL